MKCYKVRFYTEIEIDAEHEDDAIQIASEMLNEMKPHDFDYKIIKKKTIDK